MKASQIHVKQEVDVSDQSSPSELSQEWPAWQQLYDRCFMEAWLNVRGCKLISYLC